MGAESTTSSLSSMYVMMSATIGTGWTYRNRSPDVSLSTLTGRKQYGPALERLLAVLTAPSMVVNAITLTAYKKYVLVSLIQHGQARLLSPQMIICSSGQAPQTLASRRFAIISARLSSAR